MPAVEPLIAFVSDLLLKEAFARDCEQRVRSKKLQIIHMSPGTALQGAAGGGPGAPPSSDVYCRPCAIAAAMGVEIG